MWLHDAAREIWVVDALWSHECCGCKLAVEGADVEVAGRGGVKIKDGGGEIIALQRQQRHAVRWPPLALHWICMAELT